MSFPAGSDIRRPSSLCEDRTVGRYRAVLFDWRGTLVHIPTPAWLAARALGSIGRADDSQTVASINARVGSALEHPDFIEAERRIDLSAEFHRTATMRLFEHAGLDLELGESLYEVEWAPDSRPMYPDVPEVLAAIHARGVKIAVVSDIHIDVVRPTCVAHGIDGLIDVYILSCELGVQKPDARMFLTATEALGVEPSDALMVGDTARTDGGAAAVRIATLILPRPEELVPRGLDVVLGLVE
jgi:HAD superfamily hydrolase (TIGR01509 family)